MVNNKKQIVVVEDDTALLPMITYNLEKNGFSVREATNGEDALMLIKEQLPALAIIDWMIPAPTGIEVCKILRRGKETISLPIIILSAKGEEEDKVRGLNTGADDYVTKPFSLEELVARLRGILRRAGAGVTEDEHAELRVGDLVLNEDSYEVHRAGVPIELTSTEFELLRYLMRNPKRVLSKANILDRVWDYDFGGKASIVEIYISYLRKKIDTLGTPLIHTVRGVGYIIKPGV